MLPDVETPQAESQDARAEAFGDSYPDCLRSCYHKNYQLNLYEVARLARNRVRRDGGVPASVDVRRAGYDFRSNRIRRLRLSGVPRMTVYFQVSRVRSISSTTVPKPRSIESINDLSGLRRVMMYRSRKHRINGRKDTPVHSTPAGTSRTREIPVLLATLSLLALSVGAVAEPTSAPLPNSAATIDLLKTASNQIKVHAPNMVLPGNQLKNASPTAGASATNLSHGTPGKPGQPGKKKHLRKVR